jgi:D-alanine-D-alanine ligase
MSHAQRHILVLGGGPDAEREVSLTSARFVAQALRDSGRFEVTSLTIDRLTQEQLARAAGDVVFPVLHGGWGEGGQLQELLEHDGRPFVGCGSRAARWAMDKIATKATAWRLGIPTPAAHILDLRDPSCPIDFPVIIKPVHEGSTIGLYVVSNPTDWDKARAAIRAEADSGTRRAYMIEPKVGALDRTPARELTVGIVGEKTLPIIEISPADGLYDYAAKYTRNDTKYTLDPDLPRGVAETIRRHSLQLASAGGVRHLARVDFLLDASATAWLLEINTIPGFTDHSLVPMASRHSGVPMPELCATLVEMALSDARSAGSPAAPGSRRPVGRMPAAPTRT